MGDYYKEYNEVSQNVDKKYAKYSEVYPDLWFVVETDLRSCIVGRDAFIKSKYLRYKKIYSNRLSRLKYFLKRFVEYLFYGLISEKTVVVTTQRLPEVERIIRESSLFMDFRIIKNSEKLWLGIDQFVFANKKVKCLCDFVSYNGVEKIFEEKDRAKKYDGEVRLIINKIIRKLKRTNVVLVITQDCHSFSGRILLKACNEVNVRIVEVAHGYTQDNYLITLAPIFADLELVWTKRLRETIVTVLRSSEKERLVSFGFPRKKIKVEEFDGKIYVLVLIPPFHHLEDYVAHSSYKEMGAIVMFFKKNNVELMCRPHPGDKTELRDKFLKEYCGNNVSFESLSEDLKKSFLVIGYSSSVLVEAVFNGIKAIKIKSSNDHYCEGIEELSCEEVLRVPIKKYLSFRDVKYDALKIDEFDAEAFCEKMYKLLWK